MSVDNRTVINDCEANTGWLGDDTANPISDTGQFYEGSGGLSTQLSNSDEHMYTTEDSVNTGTFSLDWSDSTLYLLVKDNLVQTAASGGVQFVIGDGTDRIGYDVGGNDAAGLPLPTFFNSYKLDVSVVVTTPGSFTTFAGSEANMTHTACTQIGYGTIHLAKAVGSIDNVFMDCFRYIANGSYALTINGGTSGTPETMADVAGDDVTNGWGLVSNPVGDLYYFFGPTEWGEDAAAADHYFDADGEQWFWLGDNGGGHAVGATHFPFRVIGNATDTGSFVIANTSIVNTGTGAEFDCSSADVNTLEIDTCSMTGLASFSAPTSGGTSRFCTDTTFTSCGQITHNGASMNGCSILSSTVAADEGALLYDLNVDPDGEMDGMTFTMGANNHHAIRFGTNVPATMTLRNCTFNGFSSSDDVDGSVFRFDDTSGSITLNLVGCSTDGAFSVDDAAGVTVTVVINPVTTLINIKDENGNNEQDVRVYLEAADATGDLPYQQSITSITRSGTTATVTFAAAHGLQTNEYIKLDGITDKTEDLSGAFQVTVTSTTTLTYQTTNSGSTNYTGTITGTGATIYGTTDIDGNISSSRTYSSNQPLRGFARKATTAPYYKPIELNDVVNSSSGLTINRRLVLDQ